MPNNNFHHRKRNLNISTSKNQTDHQKIGKFPTPSYSSPYDALKFSKHKEALTAEHIPKKQGKWQYPIDKNGRMRGKVETYLCEKDKGGTGSKNYSGLRRTIIYVWYQSEWWRLGSEGREKSHRKNREAWEPQSEVVVL